MNCVMIRILFDSWIQTRDEAKGFPDGLFSTIGNEVGECTLI